MGLVPRRAATVESFRRVRLKVDADSLATSAVAVSDLNTGDSVAIPGDGLQYEIYGMHTSLASAMTVTIKDAVAGSTVWDMGMPSDTKEHYWPLASPLVIGAGKKPWVSTGSDKAAKIYMFGAIRPVK